MAAKVKKVEPTPVPPAERLFLREIWRGLRAANRHFWRNWLRRRQTPTLDYPEQKRPYAGRWRGLHRLMTREDGSVRCVACMLCSTHCPANCITVVAGEHRDQALEKTCVSFEIDLLGCIFCGLCEEACPCDAIRMDTGLHAPPVYRRADAVIGMDELLSRGGRSLAP